MTLRPINVIAAEILSVWAEQPPSENVQRFALPYVRAMARIATCSDMYGAEYGDMVVAYALNNLSNWRGEKARRIKAELKQHLEDYNALRHS